MFDLSHAPMNKVSICPNGTTLYTEKSQALKMLEPHFYLLYSIMAGSKIIAGFQPKV